MAAPTVDDFKKWSRAYIGADDYIKKTTAELKDIKKLHKKLNRKILGYMVRNNMTQSYFRRRQEMLQPVNKPRKIKMKPEDRKAQLFEILRSLGVAKEVGEAVMNLAFNPPVVGQQMQMTLVRSLTEEGKRLKREQQEAKEEASIVPVRISNKTLRNIPSLGVLDGDMVAADVDAMEEAAESELD